MQVNFSKGLNLLGKQRFRSRLLADFFLLLLVLPVLIFIVWPIVLVIAKSFFPEGSFSLCIYQQLFTDKTGLIGDSIFSALLSTGVTLVFAFAIALYVAFCTLCCRRLILIALMLTMISPPFVSSLAYIMLFGKRGLIVHHLLGLSWNP